MSEHGQRHCFLKPEMTEKETIILIFIEDDSGQRVEQEI